MFRNVFRDIELFSLSVKNWAFFLIGEAQTDDAAWSAVQAEVNPLIFKILFFCWKFYSFGFAHEDLAVIIVGVSGFFDSITTIAHLQVGFLADFQRSLLTDTVIVDVQKSGRLKLGHVDFKENKGFGYDNDILSSNFRFNLKDCIVFFSAHQALQLVLQRVAVLLYRVEYLAAVLAE